MNEVKTVKLGEMADINLGQSPASSFISNTEVGTPFLQGNAEFGSVTPSHVLYCARPKKLCMPGDILISVRAPVGALNKADRVYCIGRGLAAVHFPESLSNFGWHLLNYWTHDLGNVTQGSTFEAITKADLENLLFRSLPEEDQPCITNILDTIDAQVQETEEFISKLKQEKVGLLHNLFTCGLDANGDLRNPLIHPELFKDSDSPLGKIPNEWNVSRLEDFYAVPARNGLYKSAKYYGRGPLMIHMPQMFRGLEVDVSDAARVELTRGEQYRFKLELGDLVFARRSLNFEGAGRCSLIPELPELTTFESSIIRVRLSKERLRPTFINHFLNSGTGFRLRLPLIRQVAVSGVSSEDIAGIFVPYPPPHEQDAIIKLIDINASSISDEEAYLAKLKQVKKGLMHDLLTGRVRVADDE